MELQSIQNLERGILSAVILNNTLLKELCINLKKEDFLFLGHTIIFHILQILLKNKIQQISDETIAKHFVPLGIKEYIILDILTSAPSTNFHYDMKKIKQLSNERNHHIQTCTIKMDYEKVYFSIKTAEAFWRVEFIKDIVHQVQSVTFGKIPLEIAPTLTGTLAQFEVLGTQNLQMTLDNNGTSPSFLYQKNKMDF